MNTDDFEDFYIDVIDELNELGLKAKVREWGWLTVKEWVRDHLNQDEDMTAKQIAKSIYNDWENEQV